MEKELFDDLMEGLNDALAYAKGDKTKARSMTVAIDDSDIEADYLLMLKVGKLSQPNKQLVLRYVDELLQASVG